MVLLGIGLADWMILAQVLLPVLIKDVFPALAPVFKALFETLVENLRDTAIVVPFDQSDLDLQQRLDARLHAEFDGLRK